ncbi:MAG: hypothetical protein LKI58_06855 [Actinomyces sp.]|nr:hypothetical protein [Actinomyces sp.]MCI1641954.1 hypothetical protein [Actinomyces sp.]MCI1661967.1 hypothetical protein [Actinomyces sp.]MCI1691154.1 hypothetical protein [Actinomyces sp.]MCI1787770.1 hypothetical protein [Actinomyces sp.]MCI1830323.1 hypothetical protein [Actinomyces sp.]
MRELALLWLADDVEGALRDYRSAHHIEALWETRGRVVVASPGTPGGRRWPGVARGSRRGRAGPWPCA